MSRFKHQMGMARLRVRGMAKVSYTALLRNCVNLLGDSCELGLRVVVVTQQIDLSGPIGRMVASVLFGLAEIELEYRREPLWLRGLAVAEIAAALGVSERTAFGYLKNVSLSTSR